MTTTEREPGAASSVTLGAEGRGDVDTMPSVGVAARIGCHHGGVTVIKINAITVPSDSGDELARRFASRAGAVDEQDGFEGFELLRPTDDRTTWLVITRWRDEAAFGAWVNSPAFAHGHRPGATGSGATPVAVHSELWSYEPAGPSAGIST